MINKNVNNYLNIGNNNTNKANLTEKLTETKIDHELFTTEATQEHTRKKNALSIPPNSINNLKLLNPLDQEYLAKVINSLQVFYKDTDSAILLINLKHVILHAGAKIEEIAGISPKQLIGKSCLSPLLFPKEALSSIRNSIDTVIKLRKACAYLSINLSYKDNYIILYCVETPIINPSTGNIVALSFESRKLDFPIYLYNLITFLSNNKLTQCNFELKHKDELLTLREHEIAFLLFYCKTAKQIAKILTNVYKKPVLSKTISNIISGQLYLKFGVYGVEALMNKLYTQSYNKKIPISFITNMHLPLD